MKYFFILILCTLLLSCNNAPTKQTSAVVEVTSVAEKKPTQPTTPELNFNAKYLIHGLEKSGDYPSSVKDKTICEGWTLDESQVRKILHHSEGINGQAWHRFDHLPCVYKGKILQKGHPYELAINCGGWYRISSKEWTLMYGCFDKETKPFFISSLEETDNK